MRRAEVCDKSLASLPKISRQALPHKLAYAENLTGNLSESFKNSEIYLGFLESSDLRKMPVERREAVREFWREYFNRCDAKRIQIATDGTGQLEKFLDTKDKSR